MLDAVKQWAFTLVITAVIGTFANFFTISENNNMKKYVKFTCVIAALAVMIMPIKEIFKGFPDFFNFDYIYTNADNLYYEENPNDINELAITKTNELLKYRIYDIVYEKTGIKPDEVFIYITHNNYTETTEIEVEKIILNMPENTDNNIIDEINLYLEELFKCEINAGDKTDE